jgi:hypothetical protein
LPLQVFTKFVRARTFHFADPSIYLKRRLKRNSQMHVIRHSTDRMKMNIWHLYDSILDEPIKIRFELFGYERKTVFCVPCNVEIYLGVGSD